MKLIINYCELLLSIGQNRMSYFIKRIERGLILILFKLNYTTLLVSYYFYVVFKIILGVGVPDYFTTGYFQLATSNTQALIE